MTMNIETTPIDGDSELGSELLSLTGNDIIELAEIFSWVQSFDHEKEAHDVLMDTLAEARKALEKSLRDTFEDSPHSKAKVTVFLCALCAHAMVTVHANAQELSLHLGVNGATLPPLSEILSGKMTPPPRG